MPKVSGVASLDNLAANSTILLAATNKLNLEVPELYKRTVGESIDGITDVTVKKPTLEELESVAKTILLQIETVGNYSAVLGTVAGDVKNVNPLAAGKALKVLNFNKDVIALTLPELKNNLSVIKNLISTIKTSDNL
jgi:hypothetical protein